MKYIIYSANTRHAWVSFKVYGKAYPSLLSTDNACLDCPQRVDRSIESPPSLGLPALPAAPGVAGVAPSLHCTEPITVGDDSSELTGVAIADAPEGDVAGVVVWLLMTMGSADEDEGGDNGGRGLAGHPNVIISSVDISHIPPGFVTLASLILAI
jgi:hypothetical protein